MKKAIIADISSLSYEGKIYGHFVKAASLFKNVMDEEYNVIVAGSKEYRLNWKEIAFALTISVQRSPAPCSLQSIRNGRSVTPAIGARIKGFSISTEPIFHFISINQFPLSTFSTSSSIVSPRKNTR